MSNVAGEGGARRRLALEDGGDSAQSSGSSGRAGDGGGRGDAEGEYWEERALELHERCAVLQADNERLQAQVLLSNLVAYLSVLTSSAA